MPLFLVGWPVSSSVIDDWLRVVCKHCAMWATLEILLACTHTWKKKEIKPQDEQSFSWNQRLKIHSVLTFIVFFLSF